MDFENLFKHVPEALVVVSPGYKVVTATNAYLKLTMRRLEDIVGKHFLLEAYPDPEFSYEDNPVKKSLDKALQTKQVDYLDIIRYGIQRSEEDGGGIYEGYWEASHTPVLDSQGNVQYLIQRTSDVTERELAKQAQQESEEKFKFMTDTVPELIYTSDADGKLTYVNKRWVGYTGLSVEDSLGAGWQKVVHPDDLELTLERLKWDQGNTRALQAEMRIKGKNGEYRWFLTRSLPMEDESGNLIMRVGSSTDIHESRQMVQELLSTNEEMARLSDQVQLAFQKAESERYTLERLFMESPAFFCLLKGPDHRFELVNQHYQAIFPNRELLHKTVAQALPEVVDQGFVAILDNVFQTGETFVAEETPIFLDRDNSGQLQENYLTFTYQPLYEGNTIIGILVFGYEVTENLKLRKRIQELESA